MDFDFDFNYIRHLDFSKIIEVEYQFKLPLLMGLHIGCYYTCIICKLLIN